MQFVKIAYSAYLFLLNVNIFRWYSIKCQHHVHVTNKPNGTHIYIQHSVVSLVHQNYVKHAYRNMEWYMKCMRLR